ncbi:MAG: biopolymer transporter ExbD [Deltaproteobacteria bacterium]|jgi:biopolymer transport protein ExbD
MRRVLGGKKERRGAGVDMAPLIDMVFILLIFFMVTTSFVQETGVDISRPESATATSIEQGFVPITIDASGAVHVAGRAIPADSVRGVRTALEDSGKRRIVIQADKDVRTQLLLTVLDTCRIAGAEQVDVAAIRDGS